MTTFSSLSDAFNRCTRFLTHIAKKLGNIDALAFPCNIDILEHIIVMRNTKNMFNILRMKKEKIYTILHYDRMADVIYMVHILNN